MLAIQPPSSNMPGGKLSHSDMLSMDAMLSPRSSDSDVSPMTPAPPRSGANDDYFTTGETNASDAFIPTRASSSDAGSSRRASSISFAADLPKPEPRGRKPSAGSISLRRPPGIQKLPMESSSIRSSSPPYERFQRHVGFDNVPNGETTKNSTTSLTLNVRHKGYQARRRSRTFMVGIDDHTYSDYAIQWLLDELVDDGDEIICVRVVEKDYRFGDKQYRDDAQHVMQSILDRNGANRAISFVLEYAVGKLHATFQKLIQMYQPAMLIVGTRGRSLGGIQGLVNTRNSFSKYCLQYSPVPVVVVRPTEKRIKKKVKRTNDNSRQTYLSMLAATHGKHEADSEASSTYELEVKISADEEAHQVAKVLGLPAAFDPTIKPFHTNSHSVRPRSPNLSTGSQTSGEPPEGQRVIADVSPESAPNSDDEDDDDEEGEFEVMSGEQALNKQHQLAQLRQMEFGEAAALRHGVEDESDDSEESQSQQTKTAS